LGFKRPFGFWQLITALGILGLSILIFVYGTRPQTFEERMGKAEKLWKEKRFEEAIKVYVSLVDRDPKNPKVPEILLQVGDIYNFSLNQIDRALNTYELVTIRYPSTPYALQGFVRKGEIYFGTDQFEKALREYQNILENFPKIKDVETYRLRLGICHLKLKQFEAARREFKAILDENLKTPLADQVLFHTANSYFLEGSPTQAIPIYQSLIDHYPQSLLIDQAKFNMADCYEDLGEFDRALAIYKEIQNTYPNPKVIELQIQKNQEREAEAEKRRQEAITNQKKMKAAAGSQPASKGISEKVKSEIIKEVLQKYENQ
jgi:TolA-binding protein